MSTAFKVASADFSNGPGEHVVPLVAAGALTFGYDFSIAAYDWKNGLVAGQVATTGVLDFDGKTETAGDGGWARSLSGAVHLFGYGVIRLGGTNSAAAINPTDGVGTTLMVMGGATSEPPQTYSPLLYGGALWLGEYSNAGLFEQVGASVGQLYQPNLTANYPTRKASRTNLLILRCDGANNWILDIPNQRVRTVMTSSQLGIASPFYPNGGPSDPVRWQIGVGRTDSQLWRYNEFDLWATAGWNRALTDGEVAAQYQRLRLRFPGVLD